MSVMFKVIALGLIAMPSCILAEDCDDLLKMSALEWDHRYDDYSGEEIGQDMADRLTRNPDDLEAQVFFSQHLSAEGHVSAQYNMGVHLRQGDGGVKNVPAAVCWFNLAARQGDVDAQFTLAAMYFEGREVSQDINAAHTWSVIAASLKDADAKRLMMEIQMYMGYNDMVKSWSRADVCLSSGYTTC
jgi:TPR repeat protein